MAFRIPSISVAPLTHSLMKLCGFIRRRLVTEKMIRTLNITLYLISGTLALWVAALGLTSLCLGLPLVLGLIITYISTK